MERTSSGLTRKQEVTDALLRIVAVRGLDQVSVRQVAAEADVSIGTVQHYFPTKDDMLAAAFDEVVQRIRARLIAVEIGPDVRRNLSGVLRELLPLDERRASEVRIQVAFAARAATSPALAATQRTVLSELHTALTEAFVLAGGERATIARARLTAQVAIAATDGLGLHAVSSAGWLSRRRLGAALELLLDALVPPRA